MKKLTALILSLILLMAAVPTFAESETKWEGPLEPVVMSWLTGGVDNVYLDQVATAINDYIRDKIGVEVSFKQVSVFECASAYTRWIAAGEDFDLMCMAFVPTTPFIQMNMVLPLEDYMDNAPHIQALAAEGAPIYDPSSTEHIYSLSAIGKPAAGITNGMWFFKDALQEAGMNYEEDTVVTLDEIDQAVRAVKAKFPDSYVGVYGSAPRGTFAGINDPLGASISSGVIIGTDSTEVVNFFESDMYKKFIEITRGWYLDGIVKKDAATTDATDSGTMMSDPDNCLMMWNSGDIGLKVQYEQSTGKEVVCLYTSEKYKPAMTNVGGFMGVPVTSKHPEAALRFLDMLYYDPFVYNTLMLGIEGLNYSFNSEDRNAVDLNPSENYIALGCYGNQGLLYQYGPYDDEMEAKYDAWTAEGLANPTKGFGFFYDASSMTNQITAIDAVLAEYRAALETGSADLEKVYPEFINKLKQNGIDQVIADKQAQFDAWLNK